MGLSAISGRKVENNPAARAAKIAIRVSIADAIPSPRVFDAFAGHGSMYQGVWKKRAKHYVGCELAEWIRDGRELFIADNRRVLRAIDLHQFNVFDLDAFGSPWEQVCIVADRRKVKPGERIGMAITEGSGLALVGGAMPSAFRQLAGITGSVQGQRRGIDVLIDRAIAGMAKRMGVKVERRWQAEGRTGARMTYVGLVLVGL